MYKLVARNEKGEAASQTVEVTELPPEEKPKGEKPKLTKLTNIVSIKFKSIDKPHYISNSSRLPRKVNLSISFPL